MQRKLRQGLKWYPFQLPVVRDQLSAGHQRDYRELTTNHWQLKRYNGKPGTAAITFLTEALGQTKNYVPKRYTYQLRLIRRIWPY